MSIPENLITIGATVAGSVAIAYTTLYLQRKNKKRHLFRALYSEIKSNHSIAQAWGEKPDLIFEFSPFDYEAYNQIKITGELLNLPDSIRRKLERTYYLVNVHNRQIPAAMEIIPRDRGLHERIKEIRVYLKALEYELPKTIKYLKN